MQAAIAAMHGTSLGLPRLPVMWRPPFRVPQPVKPFPQYSIRQEDEWVVNPSLDRPLQPSRLDYRQPVHFIQRPDDAVDINGLFPRDASQSAVPGQEGCDCDLFSHAQRKAFVPSHCRVTVEIPFGLNEPSGIEVQCLQPQINQFAFLVAGQPGEFVVQQGLPYHDGVRQLEQRGAGGPPCASRSRTRNQRPAWAWTSSGPRMACSMRSSGSFSNSMALPGEM